MKKEGSMNQAMRWKRFLEWWREISPKAHLYPQEILANMIQEKIKKLQRNQRTEKKEGVWAEK
jgi:hypothetical protein